MTVWNLKYHVSEQEHIDFNTHYLLKTPEGKKSFRSIKYIAPIIFIPALIFFYINDGDITGLVIRFVIYAAVGVAMWFMAERLVVASVSRNIRRKLKKNPDLFKDEGESTFDFENGIIISRGKAEEVKVRFENVTIMYEDQRAFYLYYSVAKAIVIPYSAFETAEEFSQFRELLRNTFPTENK